MKSVDQDKQTEKQRYDGRARRLLADAGGSLGPDGSLGVPIEFRRPYWCYEDHIRRLARPGCSVLDVCCGDGLHSMTAAVAGARVTVSDIAPHNLELTLIRAQRVGLTLCPVSADAEQLPLADASFDLVTCAGSLSYVNLPVFLEQVRRVLRAGGSFVCVDSLNHNPIYRFNRYLHHLRGERTHTVVQRCPDMGTIDILCKQFPISAAVKFFGVFSFLVPVLRPLLGSKRTVRLLNVWDDRCAILHRYAFKFVFVGQKAQ